MTHQITRRACYWLMRIISRFVSVLISVIPSVRNFAGIFFSCVKKCSLLLGRQRSCVSRNPLHISVSSLTLAALLCLAEGQAANIIWNGGGATNNWSEGANWAGGVVPGSSDVAIFDGTNSKNALINANANVSGVAINAGYTGTITQGAGFTLTVGSSDYVQSAGTFLGGTSSITLNGRFNLAGGSFTATSGTTTVTSDFTHTAGGLFLHNSGTMSFSTNTATIDVSGSETFYNVSFTSGTKTVAAGDTLLVNGLLTLTNGYIETGSVEALGDLVQGSSFDGGTGSIIINGSGNQIFTGNATTTNGALPSININKAGGTLTLTGTIRTTSNWTYTAGTLDPGASTVVFALSGSGNTLTVTGAHTLASVHLNGSAHTAIASSLTVTGTLTLNDGYLDTGTVNAQGNLTQDSDFDGGTANLLINGGGNQAFTGNATTSNGTLPPININKAGGTLTLTGTIRTTSNWTYTAGTLDPGTSLVVFAVSGSSSTQTITGVQTLQNVEIAASGHKVIASNLTVAGTLTLTDGYLDTGTVQARGNITQTTSFNGGTGLILIDGTGNQILTGGGSTSNGDLPDLQINKTSGTLTLASIIRTPNDWTYTSGTLDPGTSKVVFAGTLTITGSHALNDVELTSSSRKTIAGGTNLTANGTLVLTNGYLDTGTLQARGNITQATGFDGGTGLILIDGTGNQTITGGGSTTSGNLPDLQINKTTGTLTLASTIRTGNDWTYTSGTLDPGTSRVVFAGTLTITGSHALNEVELTGSSRKTIAAATNLTANGTLVLTNGHLDTGTLLARGNITQVSGFDGGTGLILIDGTGNQTFTGGGSTTSGQLPAITINKPSGSLTLASIIRTTNHWTYVAGTLDSGGSTVVFAATLTVTGSHTLNAVEIRGAATVAAGTTLTLTSTLNMPSAVTFTADGRVVVAGTLTLTDGSIAGAGAVEGRGDIIQSTTFDGGAGTLLINGTANQVLTGGGSPSAGSLPNLNIDKAAGSLSLSGIIRTGGNWIHTSGTVNPSLSTVVFGGSTTQSVGGASTVTFDNMTIDNTSGISLAPGPLAVNGILTFTNGTITTGTSKVVVGPVASLARTSGHVNGNLQKPISPGAAVNATFEVGDATNYLPVTITFGNVTGAGQLTAGINSGNHPDVANSGVDVSKSLPRFWTVTNAGTAFDNYALTLQFAAADIPGGADPNRFIVAKKDLAWSRPTTAANAPTQIQANGMTSFSDFVVGEVAAVPLTFSLVSGNYQVNTPGAQLVNPMVVSITDLLGNPVSGSPVTFAVTSFPTGATGQSLSVTNTVSNASGRASTVLTLGNIVGNYTVTATATGVTGGTLSFVITAVAPAPVPVTTRLQPAFVTAGDTEFLLSVFGLNFVPGSAIQWNGDTRPTTYVGSNHLTALITKADIAVAGPVSITVFTPSPGGGQSNPTILSISAPTPAITRLEPSVVFAGSPELALTVFGSHFVPGSTVHWNGSERRTTYVNGNQLVAHISSLDLSKPGPVQIRVTNPLYGQNLSEAYLFTIQSLAELSFITLELSSLPGGTSTLGTVTLRTPAPVGGIAVGLSSSDPSLVGLPQAVTVPAGSASAVFGVTTKNVETDTAVLISGTYGSAVASANLVIRSSTLSKAASETVFVPIVLSVAGLNGSFYTSEVTLTNRGTSSLLAEFTYTASMGGGSGSASDLLQAGRQRILPDVISYLKSIGVPIPSTGDRGGTLKIRFSGGADGAALVTVRTTTTDPNGRAGLAYFGIRTSELLTEPSYLCGLRQNSLDRTNVAVQNAGEPSDGPIVLRLTVFSGDQLAPIPVELPEVELGPGEFRQINGILATNGLNLESGYVRVQRTKGTAPYFAYAVINDQTTSDGSFVPPSPESLMKPGRGLKGLTLPVVVKNSGFSSEVVITNVSTSSKRLLLNSSTDDLWPSSNASVNLELKPGQQVIYPDFVSTLKQSGAITGPIDQDYVGVLSVKSEDGDAGGIFVGARTSTSGPRRYGLFYTAVPFGQTATASAWICGFQQNDENRTNLALVNTGEFNQDSAVFQLEVFDGDKGQMVTTVSEISLAAGQWMQIGAFLSQHAPSVRSGYVRVSRTAGSNPFIAYGVINDGARPAARTGDGAFLSMHSDLPPSSSSAK